MRKIKFEYGFQSVNGIIKKVYNLSEIPSISTKCDVWNILPIIYVRQWTGLEDKNGKDIYEGDKYRIFGVIYTVFYVNGAVCGGKSIGSCSPLAWEFDNEEKEMIEGCFNEKIEVIVNIHEN